VEKRPQVRVARADSKRLIDFAQCFIVSVQVTVGLAQREVSLGEAWVQLDGSEEFLNTPFDRPGEHEGTAERKSSPRVSAIKFDRLTGEGGCVLHPLGSVLSGSVPIELNMEVSEPGISLGETRI